jgi:hypothetical protein
MSTRYNNGSHYENHQRAAELHDAAAHAHRAAADHKGKQDHLTGHELSRQALEHSNHAFLHTQQIHKATQEEIAARAHELWCERGCPEGSPEEDWHRAVEELKSGK